MRKMINLKKGMKIHAISKDYVKIIFTLKYSKVLLDYDRIGIFRLDY